MYRIYKVLLSLLVALNASPMLASNAIMEALRNDERPDIHRVYDNTFDIFKLLRLSSVEPGMDVFELRAESAYLGLLMASIVGPSGSYQFTYPEKSSGNLRGSIGDSVKPKQLIKQLSKKTRAKALKGGLIPRVLPEEDSLDVVVMSFDYADLLISDRTKLLGRDLLDRIFLSLRDRGYLIVLEPVVKGLAGVDGVSTSHDATLETDIMDSVTQSGFSFNRTEMLDVNGGEFFNELDVGQAEENNKFLVMRFQKNPAVPTINDTLDTGW